MKICVYGVGAIGGFLGVRLANTRACDLAAVARGPTLEALNRHGLRLRMNGQLLRAAVKASADPRDLGVQDLVLVTVKGPAMAAVAKQIAPLIGPETIVLPAMNGVPWWFSEKPLQSVDPGGGIAAAIPLRHVIGAVVHASAAALEPGLIEHRMGRGLILGEPAGNETARLRQLRDLLVEAGFEVTLSARIQNDIWYKLWGNMTMNPVSAMTGATADRILDDPMVRNFCSAAMREAAAIGERIGCKVEQSPEERHAVTRKLGAFKTSMLQDVEAGKHLELDAIVTVVGELGKRVGVETPNINALLGLARLFARVKGLYPEEAGPRY